jgi:N-acetylmuramoyl-L-alanine amidase
MVSDFIQKNVTILRILLILTMLLYYISSTLHASDVKVLLKYDPVTHFISSENTNIPALLPWDGTPKPGGKKKTTKIVIDAGHGGKDSGAVGKNTYEKDLTLKMALKVGEMIQKKYPDVEVLQTRTTDVFIPLFRRIQYANEQNADLFISIHCNYISNPKTRGTETFVMGLHRAADNLEVAKRENASILLEQNYQSNYEGFDPNSPEGHIMMSMYQNAYLDKSIEFAANVEEQFSSLLLSKSRGVKQAGFAVLRRASMPAVLVEAGFLSNEIEEAFLNSTDGQSAVSESIVRAFDKFYANNIGQKQNYASGSNTDESANFGKSSSNASVSGASSSDVKNNKNTISDNTAEQSGRPTSINTGGRTSVASVDIPTFKVQIAAFKNDTADLDSAELRKIGTLLVRKHNEINKYLVGDFVTRASAEIAREKLKNLGYKGAFIVAETD